MLIGDHAGNAVPRGLALGVAAADLARHIGWDIGVAGLGEALAATLGAPFVRQHYSRLVIDCNRDPARAEPGLTVGDNEPYAMSGIDYTVPRHAYPARRYVEFEVRQDLIATAAGQAEWAARLARVLEVADRG